MSVSCYLELGTTRPQSVIADLIARSQWFAGDPASISQQLLHEGATSQWNTLVTVTATEPRRLDDLVWRYLQIPIHACVAFHLGRRRQEDFEVPLQGDEQEASIIALTSILFEELPGDAVLHCDLTDDIWVMRRCGQVTVTDNEACFHHRWLDTFHHPYELRHQEFA